MALNQKNIYIDVYQRIIFNLPVVVVILILRILLQFHHETKKMDTLIHYNRLLSVRFKYLVNFNQLLMPNPKV